MATKVRFFDAKKNDITATFASANVPEVILNSDGHWPPQLTNATDIFMLNEDMSKADPDGRPCYVRTDGSGQVLMAPSNMNQGVVPHLYDDKHQRIDNAQIATIRCVPGLRGSWPAQVTFEQKIYTYDPGITQQSGVPSYRYLTNA